MRGTNGLRLRDKNSLIEKRQITKQKISVARKRRLLRNTVRREKCAKRKQRCGVQFIAEKQNTTWACKSLEKLYNDNY